MYTVGLLRKIDENTIHDKTLDILYSDDMRCSVLCFFDVVVIMLTTLHHKLLNIKTCETKCESVLKFIYGFLVFSENGYEFFESCSVDPKNRLNK